jgi:hypothetical protein
MFSCSLLVVFLKGEYIMLEGLMQDGWDEGSVWGWSEDASSGLSETSLQGGETHETSKHSLLPLGGGVKETLFLCFRGMKGKRQKAERKQWTILCTLKSALELTSGWRGSEWAEASDWKKSFDLMFYTF